MSSPGMVIQLILRYKAGLPWVNWGVLLPNLKMLDEEHFFGETNLSGGNTLLSLSMNIKH